MQVMGKFIEGSQLLWFCLIKVQKLIKTRNNAKIIEADGTVASSGRLQVKFRVEITDAEYDWILDDSTQKTVEDFIESLEVK